MELKQTYYVIGTKDLFISYALIDTGDADPSFSFTREFSQAAQYDVDDALAIFDVFGGNLYRVDADLTDVTNNPPTPTPDPTPDPTPTNLVDLENAAPLNDSGILTTNGYTARFVKDSAHDPGEFMIPVNLTELLQAGQHLHFTAQYTLEDDSGLESFTLSFRDNEGADHEVLFTGVPGANELPIDFAITKEMYDSYTDQPNFSLHLSLKGGTQPILTVGEVKMVVEKD